jgi:hypothetical protein
MSRHPGYNQKPRSRYAVTSGEQSVIDLIRGTAGTAMFIPAGVPHRIEKPRQLLTASSARLSMPIRSQITLFVITDHFTLAKGIRRCHVPAQLFASPAGEPRETAKGPQRRR